MGDADSGQEEPKVPTREELRAIAEDLATPIDFDDLIARGVLRKKGARYEALDFTQLPAHAMRKVQELGPGNLVTFMKVNPKIKDLFK